MSESAPGFAQHPGYQVDISPMDKHILVRVNGVIIADSNQPLEVTESRHHPVWYLPMADVNTALLTATEHATYCPFKGHASYWSIYTDAGTLDNAIWGYQEPYLECEALRDHVAFYTERVELEVGGVQQPSRAPGWTGSS